MFRKSMIILFAVVVAVFAIQPIPVYAISNNSVSTSAVGSGTNEIPNGWYMIVSGNSPDRILDINNWNQGDGGNLEIYAKNNTTNQRFYLEYKNGFYTIKALHSGKYLHIQDERNSQTNVHQWSGNNHNNARWAIRPAGNGYYYLQNKGNGSYLDNCGGSTNLGNNVISYPYNGTNAQKWKFISTSNGSDEKRTLNDGWYEVQCGNNTNYVLDINLGNGGLQDGANLEIYPRNGGNNQKFYLKYSGNGYYAIMAGHSNKYLHKQNAGRDDNVLQWGGYDANAVQTNWAISSAGGGYYYIRSKAGNYVDNSGGTVRNSNNVITYWFNKTAAQKWKFVKTSAPKSGTFAPYNGVNYRNLTNNQSRLKALDKGKEMVTVRWVSPATFVTWSSKKGEYNTVVPEGESKGYTYYEAGKTYVGIPYSMIDHTYDTTKWINLVNKGFKASAMQKTMSGYPKQGTAKGVDCSYFVYLCMKAGGANVEYQTTSQMLNGKYYKSISKSSMQPGDIFLKNGHCMLFVGKSGNNYAVFEATAYGSKTRYKVWTANELSSYGAYRYKGW